MLLTYGTTLVRPRRDHTPAARLDTRSRPRADPAERQLPGEALSDGDRPAIKVSTRTAQHRIQAMRAHATCTELWIDIRCRLDGVATHACSLMLSVDGNTTLWSHRRWRFPVGILPIGTEHHRWSSRYREGDVILDTEEFSVSNHAEGALGYVRCKDLIVADLNAARTLATALVERHRFEVDPYSTSQL